MSEWLSAAAIAGLPGLPATKRGIHTRAGTEGWTARETALGREYHIDSLPPEAARELKRIAGIAITRKAARPAKPIDDPRLPIVERPLAEARLLVLSRFQAFRRQTMLPAGRARAEFTTLYNASQLGFEPDIMELVPSISAPTLARWETRHKAHGLNGLGRQYGNRKADGLIDRDTEIRDWLMGRIANQPHLSAAVLMEGLRAGFADRPLPSYRSLQRWAANFRQEYRRTLMAIADPDAYRNKFQAAAGSRSESITRINQLWEMDSSIGDVALVDGRYAIVQVIDVATRRTMYHVSRTSTAAAIAALLRKALLAWGVPERIKMDNGADYTSRGIETILANLQIERDLCTPFQPQQKPHVERCFKTFQHQMVEALPGYVGHSVAERKGIESRRSFAQRQGETDPIIQATLTADDFQAFADRWAQDHYAHTPHAGLGGRTPFQMAAELATGVRAIEDERGLDILLLPASGEHGTRVVTKKGLAVAGGHYAHAALGAIVGDTVQVSTDPADLGHIYVFDLDNRFICEAIDHFRLGISRQEVATEKRRVQRQAEKAAKADLRARMRKVNQNDLVASVARHKAEEAGRVLDMTARLPRATHTTPELEEAGRAARAGDFTPRQDTPEEAEARRNLAQRLAGKPAPVTPLVTRQMKIERALAIGQALEAGEPVSAEDRAWHAAYTQSTEFTAYLRRTGREAVSQDGRNFETRRV